MKQTEDAAPLYGLVLAGGASRRLGLNKAHIQYYEKPQYVHLAQLMSSLCKRVCISCKEISQFTETEDHEFIEDIDPGIGALAGVHSAFAKYPDVAWLVIAIDLPLLREDELRSLIGKRDVEMEITAFKHPDRNMPEPFAAIWEPAARKKLLSAIEAAEYSATGVLERCHVAKVAIDPGALMNVNTRQDYDLVMKILEMA